MIEQLIPLIFAAGKAILEIDRSLAALEEKGDGSPVSKADKAADLVIRNGLHQLFPGIPVITEESYQPEQVDITMETFFLVDPLDGTKEYLAGRPEYTVNIAYIEKGRPIFGLIGIPEAGLLYAGNVMTGQAWKQSESGQRIPLVPSNRFMGILAVSRSHRSESEEKFRVEHGFTQMIEAGSSLKGCLVAEGKADCYFRAGNVMAWDIAAMDAVLTASSCSMVDAEQFKPLQYSLRDLRIRSGFIAGRIK